MGLPGMAWSVISFAAGAILYWAVTYNGPDIRLSTVGFILMVVGGIGFVVSVAIFALTRNGAALGRHTSTQESVNSGNGPS
jgi:hypothetical protein